MNASLLRTVALSTGGEPRCATLGLANAHSETCLSVDDNDKKTISDLTPSGYDFVHIPRLERKRNEASKTRECKERGDGVGLLFKSSFKARSLQNQGVQGTW